MGLIGRGRIIPASRWFVQGTKALLFSFHSKFIRGICEDEAQAKAELPASVAESLKHRLADLRAASVATDLIAGRPRAFCDGEGECMAVDLAESHRLVFTANHVKNPMIDKKSFDWKKVTRIKILRIEKTNA